MKKTSKLHLVAPALLFFSSPIIAEIFSGSTPISRMEHFIPQMFFYGSGALLIRETARRFHLGLLSIVMMGLGFGIIEEALALQSVFNPQYFGLDISYGRLWGINWIWSFYIIGYHAIWSITIPIVLSELVFPLKAKTKWLNKIGYVSFGIIFVFMTVSFYFIFQKQTQFSVPAMLYILAILIAAVLIFIAFHLPVSEHPNNYKPSLLVGFIAFLGGGIWLWLFTLMFGEYKLLPAWMLLILGITDILIVFVIAKKWLKKGENYYQFPIVCGGLLVNMLFGLNILIESDNKLDLYFHIALIFSVGVFLILLAKKVYKMGN